MFVDLAAALQTVVNAFAAVPGVQTASTDPGAVTAPGAVVQLVGIDPLTLGGRIVTTQVLLVVTDSDGGPGPAAALSQLWTACEAAGITADGTILPRTVQLPTSPAPLPGLLIPIEVRIPA